MHIEFGTLPAALVLSEAEGQLMAQSELVQLACAGSDPERHYLMLMYHASAQEAISPVLKELGWTRVNLRDWSGTAADNDRRLTEELAQVEQELLRAEQQLKESGDLRGELWQVTDCAGVEISRAENDSRLLSTDQTFLLSGWGKAASAAGCETHHPM
jgi:V/A-type H+-transporting ATPase subunit I